MEEIKVGEYVRTNRGMISKVVEIRPVKHKEKDTIDDAYILEKGNWTIKQLIVSHSPNLIDLIEVGDYVSSKDGIEGKVDFVMLPLKIFVNGEEVLNDEIKSIVTHEQFAQIEYKVEE